MGRTFGHQDAWSASGSELTDMLSEIVRNKPIDDFLRDDSRCYLIGPKGTGKTLLLLKKGLEKRNLPEVRTIPPRGMEDPVDRSPFFGNLGHKFYRKHQAPIESDIAWTSVWLHAIVKAVIYDMCRLGIHSSSGKSMTDSKLKDYEEAQWRNIQGEIQQLFGTPPYYRLKTVSDFYKEDCQFLDDAPREGLDRVRHEIDLLSSLYRDFRVPYYVFIDNLDEWYQQWPEFWLTCIFGNFQAIRSVRLNFRDIHIYTSIRQDIYGRFSTEKLTQYDDFISFLNYNNGELMSIFEGGIRRLDNDLLQLPGVKDDNPMQAFFGDVKQIANKIVEDKSEPVDQYLIRHTLLRPRDMITIGNWIIRAKGTGQIDEDTIRTGVSEAAQETAKGYLEEIKPLVDARVQLLEFISQYFPSNIIDRKTAEHTCRQYNEDRQSASCQSDCSTCYNVHPVCALYEVGLLGYAHLSPVNGKQVQSFLRPGEVRYTSAPEKVPPSIAYFLHPILDEYLGNERVNKKCIVGYNLPFDPKVLSDK
ncbi:MAG: hypothetical protein WC566_02480 [Dehalococcoidia bacterium]